MAMSNTTNNKSISVTMKGRDGLRVPNFLLQNLRPTSMAPSILEYGVFLYDIIPHMATVLDTPKKGR